MLVFSVVLITLALICYSIGVWSEKIQGSLRAKHLIFFWLGFIFDSSSTMIMGAISHSSSVNLHSISGIAAILLMFLHAVWASIVLLSGKDEKKRKFSRFSILVWCLWLVPYSTGAVMNML